VVRVITQHLDACEDHDLAIRTAGQLLRDGELVAIPTETVYGLAACISNEEALGRIFVVKGRPSDNPLIVHIAQLGQVDELATVDATSRRLIDVFWPGALTLVLPKRENVGDRITAGLDTVAIRMPSLAITREIIRAAGEPLAAPSANTSGKPSATTAQHVLSDFGGRIAAVVDAGPCVQGIESTVVRVVGERVIVLRPGSVTRAQLVSAIGGVVELSGPEDADSVTSPGTRHRHYAPQATVVLCNTVEDIGKQVATLPAGFTAVLLAVERPAVDVEWRWLTSSTLYAELRRADDLHVNKILVHCTAAVQLDEALMNRLRKASEPFIESV